MDGRTERTRIAAVAAGGVIGASARWAIGTQLAPDESAGFPWHTFAVNVVGCVLIGVASARIRRPSIGWDFVATGTLGGFTTVSAFAVELNQLVDARANAVAIAYLVASVGVGLLGFALAEALSGSVDDEAERSDGVA